MVGVAVGSHPFVLALMDAVEELDGWSRLSVAGLGALADAAGCWPGDLGEWGEGLSLAWELARPVTEADLLVLAVESELIDWVDDADVVQPDPSVDRLEVA